MEIDMEEDKEVEFSGLMPLMNTAFVPGRCKEAVLAMPEGPEKEIAAAEYEYFRGNPREAAKKAQMYLDCQDRAVRLSACLIYGYANLSIGQIRQAGYALRELKKTLKSGSKEPPESRAMESFLSFTAAVLLHLPLPEELPEPGEYLRMLPPGIRIFAMYVRAHYYYLQEDYSKSLGIVEGTVSVQDAIYPIPMIYIHLVAVMDCISLKQLGPAKEHLLAAWELAKPDDLVEAFGEHHGLLGGMLEAVIKKNWPEDFKRIIAITYQFSAGWRKIHNPATGHEVAENLTTTEFATAMLAARGWTNKEIAEHMNVSANTVKSCIASVLQKLHIRNRKELKRYMLP